MDGKLGIALVILLVSQAKGQAVIGEIHAADLNEATVKWGSHFMGDAGAYPNATYEKPKESGPVQYDEVTYVASPNDPGLDAWGDLGLNQEHSFMKYFGYSFDTDQSPLTPDEVALLRWVEDEGLESPCATIAHFKHPQYANRTLRGLVANCTIRANKALLRIPTKLIVTPHRLSNSPMYAEIYELLKLDGSISFDLDHLMLTLFVALDSQDANSYWTPYLRLLPEEVLVPAESDDYSMLWYDASTIVDNNKNRLKAISYQFDHISAFFAQHPQLLPKFHHFNKAKFSWAYNIVTSRSFRLDFGVHRDALCLVPYADLMNHGFTNVGWLFQGKQNLGFFSAHQIDPGQQIFNNYGPLGNEWLIQDFGFVLQDNPYTCAHVILPEPSLQDPIRDKRLALLKTQDLDFQTPVCVRMGPPSLELLFAALALSAPSEVLSNNLTPENLPQYINEDTLPKIIKLLVPALQDRLTHYRYSMQQDERLLPLVHASANQNVRDNISVRRFDAVFLRLEEKLILESNILFLNLTAGYKCIATLPFAYEGADDKIALERLAHTCNHYMKKVMIPLLKDIAWQQSRKYVKPRPRKGAPFETWDFQQDPSVDVNEGMPTNPCKAGESAAACSR